MIYFEWSVILIRADTCKRQPRELEVCTDALREKLFMHYVHFNGTLVVGYFEATPQKVYATFILPF